MAVADTLHYRRSVSQGGQRLSSDRAAASGHCHYIVVKSVNWGCWCDGCSRQSRGPPLAALFAHLATVRPDGAPLVNRMWFLWDEARGVVKLTHTKRRSNYNFFQSEPRVA